MDLLLPLRSYTIFLITNHRFDTMSSIKSNTQIDEAISMEKSTHTTITSSIPSSSEKALLRKIDLRIIPLMFCCYLMQFLDKVMINYANVMGLSASTHLKNNEFSWIATAFFVAYALAEIPQGPFFISLHHARHKFLTVLGMLLQKYPAPYVLGINVIGWGIAVACTAACNSFASLLAVRIILGALEAVISPALVLITSTWYQRTEATPRIGIWYCGLGSGQILGGLLSFAFQHVTAKSFECWRVMFVVVGVVNALLGVGVLVWLPTGPAHAKWLTQEEKVLATKRLEGHQRAIDERPLNKSQIWDAVTDLQVWLLCGIAIFSVLPSGVITTFSATLIRGFGYNSKEAALLNIPSGVVSILSTIASTMAISRGYTRWISVVILAVPTIIGGALMSFLPKNNQAGSLAGIYMINCIVVMLAFVYSWLGGNITGYTKKVS